MTTRRRFALSAAAIAGLVTLAALFALWRAHESQPDQVLAISSTALERLAELRRRPKYVEEPDRYTGIQHEPERRLAEAQLNDLIDRLRERLQAIPRKSYVLAEFRRTMLQFGPGDTEDRERLIRYLEEIMDILGIAHSDGALGGWLYGSLIERLTPWR